jgi:ABC-type uncharacterized transport system permease subunit
MLIGCGEAVLVGVIVGLAVGVGSGVLLGDGVMVGLGVRLGTTFVALGGAVVASLRITFPFVMHPPVIKTRSNPKHNPDITLVEFLDLPINSFILDNFRFELLL